MSIADAYRQKVKVELEEVTLPSGAVFRLRRVPLASWMATGRIDADLLGKITNVSGRLTGLSFEDITAALGFIRDAVLFACIEPRLIIEDREPAEDELHVNELAAGDFEALAAWVIQSGKIAPVSDPKPMYVQKQPGNIPMPQ